MNQTTHLTRRRPGRPRDPRLEQRVRRAAVEEYAERGWAAFTMDGVARRARVGKSTLYLRWPDKDALLADATATATADLPDVDTGTLAGDLTAIARNLYLHFQDPVGWAAFRISVDAAGKAGSSAHDDVVHREHRKRALALVDRAVSRGELSAEVPGQVLIEMLYGAFAMRRLVRGVLEPDLVQADVERLIAPHVAMLLAALEPWRTDRDDRAGRADRSDRSG